MAALDDSWITVHPNGKEVKGSRVLLGESGEVKGGLGGKFTGRHISEVKGRAKSGSSSSGGTSSARARLPDGQEEFSTPLKIQRETEKAYGVENPDYKQAQEILSMYPDTSDGRSEAYANMSYSERNAFRNNERLIWLPKSRSTAENGEIIGAEGWLAKKAQVATKQAQERFSEGQRRYDDLLAEAKAKGVKGVRTGMRASTIREKIDAHERGEPTTKKKKRERWVWDALTLNDSWITVHPNGKDVTGSHVLLGENGEVKGGDRKVWLPKSRTTAENGKVIGTEGWLIRDKLFDPPLTYDKGILSFDASPSKRRKDNNGYLHVDVSNITKEQVAPYYGDEIPDWQELGLEPGRLYYMYRPADELQKAVDGFNGMPILFEHHQTNAERPAKDYVIGSLGTDAEFRSPYVVNSLIFTDGEAIDAIERGEYKELSAAYVYTPVMKGGIFNGEHYDGKMTDIRPNHVALVKEGRAGPDVAVADAKPAAMQSTGAVSPKKEDTKNMKKKAGTRGVLAFDAVPAIEQAEVNLGTLLNALQVVEAQREGLDPRTKLDLDIDANATIDEIVAKFFPMANEEIKSAMSAILESMKNAPATGGEDKAQDDDDDDKSFAEGVKYGEELMRSKSEREKLDREHESEGMRRAMDECGIDADDPVSSKAFAEGVKYGERLMRSKTEREKLDREHEAEGMRKAMEDQKAAMDAQIKSVKEKTAEDIKAHYKALYAAAQDCRPVLGNLVDPMAFDSADDIYRKALTAAGVDVKGVHPSAFPAMLKMARSKAADSPRHDVPIAMDSKTDGECFKGALEGLARIMR